MKLTEQQRHYTIQSLRRYWPQQSQYVLSLPLVKNEIFILPATPVIKFVQLPVWAEDLGVKQKMLVPDCLYGEDGSWETIDWISVLFYLLNALPEQNHEQSCQVIHSYSGKLKNWPSLLWEHAWVNRIALFLRRWAAKHHQLSELELFGELPEAEIILSHDVDAVRKTLPIRIKQSVFHSFNCLRAVRNGNITQAAKKLKKAIRTSIFPDNYNFCQFMAEIEHERKIRSHFNIYGGRYKRKNVKQWLMDPSYDIAKNDLKKLFNDLHQLGHHVGLHQSFTAWQHADLMMSEKKHIENALNVMTSSCRQHWLRFSWQQTWAAQQEAGFTLDTTLGFNDRPGFRNSAALQFSPWNFSQNTSFQLESIPLILMDSHLYDYQLLNEQQRYQTIATWIDEVKFVRGVATVLWHPHTLSHDYGWKKGYLNLLDHISQG